MTTLGFCFIFVCVFFFFFFFFFLMIRRPPRSTQSRSSAASDVYKRQLQQCGGVAYAALGAGLSAGPQQRSYTGDALQSVALPVYVPDSPGTG